MDEQTTAKADLKNARWLYAASALFALVCLAVIVWIWQRVYNAPPKQFPDETIVTSQAEIENYLLRHLPDSDDGALVFIPTGVVIQSLEYKGPYTVQAAGYVWQRYADGLPELDKGVLFAEADTTTFTKVYETKQAGETLVGWNFKTTLRQQFDYAHYPLDRQEIRLRIWTDEFEKNVYLVPDTIGYTTIDSAALPGVDPNVLLENWEIERAYFSFRLNQYNANFGIQGYAAQRPQPELYYNVSIKRYILSPLISRGIAPLVILLQLFVIVMVIGTDSQRLEQFGVRPGAVIFTCAAFLFAILLAQNALRDEVKWHGIVYLETVYVLTYFVILAVAANSVTLVAFPKSRLFVQDNLPVEALYWPLILFILLLVTLWTFVGFW